MPAVHDALHFAWFGWYDGERGLMVYSVLARLLPAKPVATKPQRIVFIRPCCIGDVVMATAALSALRQTFPRAHITWAVGSWSARAVAHHRALDAILDTGAADMPVRSLRGMLHFVRQLRAGHYDMAVSLVRSPLMSLAVYLSGIPLRAGLDSAGRGFGYNLRLPVDPTDRAHESEIYLKLISAMAGQELHAYANLPLSPMAKAAVKRRLAAARLANPYIVAHPGGGGNPGMKMDSKRYPPAQLAQLLNHVAEKTAARVILIGGPKEGQLVEAVARRLNVPAVLWVDKLSFQEIAALAADALFYIGNDTGLTHLAAASGARTVMMMGPTDPSRYAPYTPNHLVLWKPTQLAAEGVAAGKQRWDWARDGFSVAEGAGAILDFLDT